MMLSWNLSSFLSLLKKQYSVAVVLIQHVEQSAQKRFLLHTCIRESYGSLLSGGVEPFSRSDY